MLKVITVLRSSAEYSVEKVLAVHAMVERNLTIPHEFICLSDVEILGVKTIPLKHNWPGWYAKMEIYRNDLPEGPKLYLDLDTSIVSNMDSVLEAAAASSKPFVILRDFYRGAVNPLSMGSGFMYWNMDMSFLYEWYVKNPISIQGGDQILLEKLLNINHIAFWQDITPAVCSFKVHIRPLGYILPKYSVVCFHGKPRPWEQTIVPYKYISNPNKEIKL
jgi:hypothetical protein